MTDHDIVDELRGFAGDTQSARASLMRDAADKIEELRADLERWEQVWVHVGKPGMFEVPKPLAVELEVGRLKAVDRLHLDEIERLRGAIRAALDFEAVLPAIATTPKRILTEALEPVEGDGDAHDH